MQKLLKSKEYSWSLFIGHLVIEKLLKALYVKKMEIHAILSHDLLRIAKKINIDIPQEYEAWLDEITTFKLMPVMTTINKSFINVVIGSLQKNG